MSTNCPFDGCCDRCGAASDDLQEQVELKTIGLFAKLRFYWMIFTGRSPWERVQLCADCRGREKDYALIGLIIAIVVVVVAIGGTIWAMRLTP